MGVYRLIPMVYTARAGNRTLGQYKTNKPATGNGSFYCYNFTSEPIYYINQTMV